MERQEIVFEGKIHGNRQVLRRRVSVGPASTEAAAVVVAEQKHRRECGQQRLKRKPCRIRRRLESVSYRAVKSPIHCALQIYPFENAFRDSAADDQHDEAPAPLNSFRGGNCKYSLTR